MPVVKGLKVPAVKNVEGVLVPSFYSDEIVKDSLRITPQPGDIVLATYPKCGTNWASQIIMTLLKKGKPPCDAVEIFSLLPFLEFSGPESLRDQIAPRRYRYHFNYKIAPVCADAKYIYVTRNPKDCLISLYHFQKSINFDFEDGDFNVLFELFLKGEVLYNDYFDHVLSWYERRNDPNVLFLYFEKMKADPGKAILKIAKHMGSEYEKLVEDPKILADVIEFSSFKYMKKSFDEQMGDFFTFSFDPKSLPNSLQKAMKFFEETIENITGKKPVDPKLIRKGDVGDGKVGLTSEQNQKLDELINKKLKGTEMYKVWKDIGCI